MMFVCVGGGGVGYDCDFSDNSWKYHRASSPCRPPALPALLCFLLTKAPWVPHSLSNRVPPGLLQQRNSVEEEIIRRCRRNGCCHCCSLHTRKDHSEERHLTWVIASAADLTSWRASPGGEYFIILFATFPLAISCWRLGTSPTTLLLTWL